MNKVILIGRLTKDIELRTTTTRINNVSFTLAVDRNFKNSKGEREADFIQCVAWNKTAEILYNYCAKGSLVAVDGEIRTRNYQDNIGKRVYVTEVNVNSVQLLNTGNSNQVSMNVNTANADTTPFEELGASLNADDPFMDDSIPDNKLPF